MRFLLDVCASSRSMQAMLVAQGHDVWSALEKNPKATDEENTDRPPKGPRRLADDGNWLQLEVEQENQIMSEQRLILSDHPIKAVQSFSDVLDTLAY